MTGIVWVAVALVGGVGAVARFELDRAVTRRTNTAFPIGTFVVNISGATTLGVISGAALPPSVALIAGTGLIGAYTTFSTWTYETYRLTEERQRPYAVLNIIASVLAGLIAAACGQLIGEHL